MIRIRRIPLNLMLAVTLLGSTFTAVAQNSTGRPTMSAPQAKAPSLQDIEAWIADNISPDMGNPMAQALTFDGCSATFTVSHKQDNAPGADTIATTLRLDKLDPDAVTPWDKFYKQGEMIQIHSENAFTFHSVAYMISADVLYKKQRAAGNSPMDYERTEDEQHDPNIYIRVADSAMADRMAHAWHDAISACVGSGVPKNLY